MQPHYCTHCYSRMFVRISALTLDAMGVCARARVCQGSTRSRRPPGGRFSPLHASPARRCTRVRSPTDYDACSCAYVQPISMQCVCACVQMAYACCALTATSWGSVFALVFVCTAPIHVQTFMYNVASDPGSTGCHSLCVYIATLLPYITVHKVIPRPSLP